MVALPFVLIMILLSIGRVGVLVATLWAVSAGYLVALALVPEKGRLEIADLGTGSGCLLAALLSWRWARQQLSQGMPFAASVAELNRDRRALDSEWGAR